MLVLKIMFFITLASCYFSRAYDLSYLSVFNIEIMKNTDFIIKVCNRSNYKSTMDFWVQIELLISCLKICKLKRKMARDIDFLNMLRVGLVDLDFFQYLFFANVLMVMIPILSCRFEYAKALLLLNLHFLVIHGPHVFYHL